MSMFKFDWINLRKCCIAQGVLPLTKMLAFSKYLNDKNLQYKTKCSQMIYHKFVMFSANLLL